MFLLAAEGLPAFGVVLASVVAGALDWDQVSGLFSSLE